MKISHKWLTNYINTTLETEQISEILTDIGLEVESLEKIETIKGGLKGVVVGKVLTCEKHPDADKLSITTVNIGLEEPVQIVCGAPNVAAGQLVPVATIGTVLYSGDESFQIKRSKIRGVESMGMICAEDELGLGVSHAGIMALDPSATIGMDARTYFGIEDDYVYEIGLTPNRSDAMAHFGVARDLASALSCREIEKIEAKLPSVDAFIASKNPSIINIQVEDLELCPRYSGLHIKNITVKESPKWLQNRLLSIGIRPINNIVDVTNFILFELGQPLHAFDASKIKGNKIVVRKSTPQSKFTTLDGIERALNGTELMICNADKEMCIAGVYGGMDTGVSDSTKEIFLESAYFNPVSVRKTSKLHGLKTDSSFRFERGCDPEMTIYALKRAALLIQEVAGGEIASEIVDHYPTKLSPYQFEVSYSQINNLIGTEIKKETVKQILTTLGITIKVENQENLTIEVPLFKVDVTRPIDIIEEVLRIYGFNTIENPNMIQYRYAHQAKQPTLELKTRISSLLADQGMLEAMNNSLTKLEYFEKFSFLNPTSVVKLLNPLSRDLGAMRQSLLPGLLENISYNLNHKNGDVKLFEFGNIYHYNADAGSDVVKKYPEQMMLDLILSGNKQPENWNQSIQKIDFYELKRVVFTIIQKSGIDIKSITLSPINNEMIDGLEISFRNQSLGFFGEVIPSVLKSFGIKQAVYYATISWSKFVKAAISNKLEYQEINHYPEVRRDLALLVDKSVTFEQIKEVALKADKKLLKSVGLFDVYEGDKIDGSKKSYAVNFTLQHQEKTLSEAEITKTMAKITDALVQIGAHIRQ